MRRTTAALGSMIFFALAPGVVAGFVPWWLTGWRVRQPLPSWAETPLRVLGVALIAAGAVVLVQAFVRFVAEGVGTPAPIAPTQKLVVGGLYRYVRNPMYLAVIAVMSGRRPCWVSLSCWRTPPSSDRPWRPSPMATKNRPWLTGSAPSTRHTGARCRPGGRAYGHGSRMRLIAQAGMKHDSAPWRASI